MAVLQSRSVPVLPSGNGTLDVTNCTVHLALFYAPHIHLGHGASLESDLVSHGGNDNVVGCPCF